MIEGTSDPFGSIWCAIVARRLESTSLLPHLRQQSVGFENQWEIEAQVFSTNFRLGFEPGEFQTILPKNLIHRVVPGEPIHDFFETWKASAAEMSSVKIYGIKQWFIATAERMHQRGYNVAVQRKWLAKGFWSGNPLAGNTLVL